MSAAAGWAFVVAAASAALVWGVVSWRRRLRPLWLVPLVVLALALALIVASAPAGQRAGACEQAPVSSPPLRGAR